MFKDEVYDELDDISKLIEPYQYSMNDEISKFPDEVEIHAEDLFKGYTDAWGFSSLRLAEIIVHKAKELGISLNDTPPTIRIRDLFGFKVKDLEEGESIYLNTKDSTLSHKLFLVKKAPALDDDELEKLSKDRMINPIKQILWNSKSVNKKRLNEIAELYGALEVKKDRTYRGKVSKFCAFLSSLIDDKKLNIKNVDLAEKFGTWIGEYVRDGNLPALNNITKIKIMMREDKPIYSIVEVK